MQLSWLSTELLCSCAAVRWGETVAVQLCAAPPAACSCLPGQSAGEAQCWQRAAACTGCARAGPKLLKTRHPSDPSSFETGIQAYTSACAQAMASPSASPEAEPRAEGELDATDAHAWHCTMAALRQDEANCDVVFVVGYGPWRSPLIIAMRDGTPAPGSSLLRWTPGRGRQSGTLLI